MNSQILGNSLIKKKWNKPLFTSLSITKDTFGNSGKWTEGHPNKPAKP